MDIQTTIRYRSKIDLLKELGMRTSEDLETLGEFLLELTVGQSENQNLPNYSKNT